MRDKRMSGASACNSMRKTNHLSNILVRNVQSKSNQEELSEKLKMNTTLFLKKRLFIYLKYTE